MMRKTKEVILCGILSRLETIIRKMDPNFRLSTKHGRTTTEDKVADALDALRVMVTYLQFDIEATTRELDKARKSK